MNAPLIWILLPFALGLFVLFFISQKYAGLIGGAACVLLSLAALFVPIDTALLIGSFSLKIAPSVELFGRSFTLGTADGSLLAIIYGLSAFWFFGVHAPQAEKRFISFGLMIVALLTASIAVEPFLYAALLLEMAALLVIPLLVPLYQKAGRGTLRFLIYQTLAMPFILFSGWMLAGVEASPGDLVTTIQSGAMLGLGFAFLFGVFPLYNWIPMLMEEVSPYVTGFLLWAFSTFTTILALGFLDRYTWMRNSPELSTAILFAATLTVASAGLFAAIQKHIGRMMGYAAIFETGLLVLALGIRISDPVNAIFLLLIPRGMELVIWALAISIIKKDAYSLRLSEVRGLARKYPIAVGALVIAHLSTTGLPLLAGFPSRFILWREIAQQTPAVSIWVFVGTLGVLLAAIRTLAVFVMADENTPWQVKESWQHIVMLVIGIVVLFGLGIFPQTLQPFTQNLPALFEHLGR